MRKIFFLIMLVGSCRPAMASGIYNPGSTGAGGGGGYALQPATVTIVAAQGITLPDNTTVSTGAINLSQMANVASANGIINGNFQFWQRGLSFAWSGAGGYKADRWAEATAGATPGGGFVRVSTVTHSAQYALQINITINTSVTAAYLRQPIENYYEFANSSVTVTAWVNSNTGTTIAINDSNGTTSSSAHTGNSTWQQLSVTRFVSTTTTSMEIRLANQANPAVSVQYFDGVMMVPGDTPINYVPRPYADELAMCQRYYEKSYALDTVPGSNTGTNLQISIGALIGVNTVSFHYISFKVPMRIAPGSISIWDQSGTSGKWSTVGTTGSGHSTSITGTQIGTNGFNGNENSNADTYAEGHWSADAEMP